MKTIYAMLLLIAAAAPCAFTPCAAQTKGDAPRTIEDYFKLLPAEYVTHAGDYGPLETISDARNGYYAVAEKTRLPAAPERDALVPVFEFALYRKADGGAIFVAANTIYDHACFTYETYFLRHDGARWSSVAKEVAPRLGPELFFRDPEAVAALRRDKNWASYLRHRLARRGTTIQVTPRLCDTAIEHDDTLSERERAKLLALARTEPKTVTLGWDRAGGRFRLVR